ncbi:MAG: winged helix-turn-helix domain-containing protein [Oscillospiraceae bacterium]|nr:winged helix-turn-helix domain-containing protein [Oscillospiraceae bacterium]
MEPIQIRMLGNFSMQLGNKVISDSGNRSKKVWALMAYLVYHRGRVVPQRKLIDLLWGEESASSNPENTLRITLHRARTLLETLSTKQGRDYILHKDDGYIWNPAIPVQADWERFDALCQASSQDAENRLQDLLEALSLYGGEFLTKQSSEIWVIPVSTHFQNCFLNLTMEASELLFARSRYPEAVELCRKAISEEPYHEPLHQMLMRLLAAMGDNKGAAEVYKTLSTRLFDDFGIRPNEETQAVYRASAHSPDDRTLPMEEILSQLQEPDFVPGAMQCDYDYFKVLCFAESRSMERSGNATHIALLSVSTGIDKPIAKRSLNRVMELLGSQLRQNLRRGDTISQCSVSQYIVMLPNANYENSCMVCKRVIGAFYRNHPHVVAKINYMVQPLTPHVSVP